MLRKGLFNTAILPRSSDTAEQGHSPSSLSLSFSPPSLAPACVVFPATTATKAGHMLYFSYTPL